MNDYKDKLKLINKEKKYLTKENKELK